MTEFIDGRPQLTDKGKAVLDLLHIRPDLMVSEAVAIFDDLGELTPKAAEDERRRAVLFNDLSRDECVGARLLLSERLRLRDHLWEQGWRRHVRPEDVTE